MRASSWVTKGRPDVEVGEILGHRQPVGAAGGANRPFELFAFEVTAITLADEATAVGTAADVESIPEVDREIHQCFEFHGVSVANPGCIVCAKPDVMINLCWFTAQAAFSPSMFGFRSPLSNISMRRNFWILPDGVIG